MVDPKSGLYDDLPHIGPGNIESFTGRLFDNVHTVKEDALISGKFHFFPGDVIYGKINPQLGKYVFAQVEGLASADAYVLNGFNGINQEFLFALLQTERFFKYSVSVSMRSGMPKINRDELDAFGFLAPKEDEQRRIGRFLRSLDNLITLHQRKHEKLLIFKKSMLEKMFPKDGALEPEIRFKGFTGPWEQRKFSEIATRSGEMTNEPSLLQVEYEDVVAGQGVLNKDLATKTGGKTGLKFSPGDVLYGKLRPYLKNWLLPAFSGVAVGDWWVLKPIGMDPQFLYSLIQSDRFQAVANVSAGSKMPRADWALVSDTDFRIPSNIAEQRAIGSYLAQLDQLITLHQRELEKLKTMKESLLQKMFV